MVRIRTGGLVAVLAFGLLGTAACNKDKKGTHGSSAGGTSDLSLLPADSELVVSINVAQLRSSALWKDVGQKLMDKANDNDELKDFKTACGVDPMTEITGVSLGMKGIGGDAKPDGVIVVHGLSKAKITAKSCLDKLKAEAAKDGGSVTQDGDVYLNKDSDGTTAAMFIDDNTLLLTGGTLGTKDAIMAAAKGTSALKTSPAFTDIFKKVNTNQSMWFVMNGNSPALADLAAMGMKPKALYGSLNVTDGLSLDAGARFNTPDEAKNIADMAKKYTDNPQIKGMVDKLDVKADGTDLSASVSLSKAKLDALKSQFGMLLGGLGGMGGQ